MLNIFQICLRQPSVPDIQGLRVAVAPVGTHPRPGEPLFELDKAGGWVAGHTLKYYTYLV